MTKYVTSEQFDGDDEASLFILYNILYHRIIILWYIILLYNEVSWLSVLN